MNPKQFLQIGGVVLVVLAIYGWVVPQTPGSFFWLDSGENWAHLVLGVVALAAAYGLKDMMMQKYLVMAVGALGILVGLYSLLVSESFLGSNLENPADTILHLVVGAWALWAAMRKPAMMG